MFFFFDGEVGEIEGFVGDGGVHVEDVVDGGFEVAGGVIALGDEEAVSFAVDGGMEDVFNLQGG